MYPGEDRFARAVIIPRLNSFVIILSLIFIYLTIRLIYLQIIQGKYYHQISEENRIQLYFEHAPRGIIFDNKGEVLVDNVPSFVLYFTPVSLSQKQMDNTISRLSDILNIKETDLKEKFSSPHKQVLVQVSERISREQMFKLEENRYALEGIDLDFEFRRRYKYGKMASHLIGYLGEIDKGELDQWVVEGYKRGDLVGKNGVERVYDKFLRGEDGGLQIEVDAHGNQKRILRRVPSSIGRNLYLTIDRNIQQIAEDSFKGLRGAVVVLNPQNGEVLALVSSPACNSNWFVEKTSYSVTNVLLADPALPFFNRALQGRYPPGSIFKIIDSAAALEKEKISVTEEFFCPGSFVLGKEGRVFGCWKKEGHGRMSFINGLTNSCDVYFYHVGLKCGIDLLEEYSKKFGFEKYSQIDLPGESLGLVPSRIWKKKRFNDEWYDGDTVNVAIGQGYVLVTPLLAANLISTVANRGKLFQPHVVNKITDTHGEIIWEFKPKEILHVDLKPQTWDLVIQGLENVVDYGTGYASHIDGIRIAGKTGTAQNPHGKDHAWFIAYAPVENPVVAVSVFVEHGGHGGSAAAPIAQRIILAAIKGNTIKEDKNIQPEPENKGKVSIESD